MSNKLFLPSKVQFHLPLSDLRSDLYSFSYRDNMLNLQSNCRVSECDSMNIGWIANQQVDSDREASSAQST